MIISVDNYLNMLTNAVKFTKKTKSDNNFLSVMCYKFIKAIYKNHEMQEKGYISDNDYARLIVLASYGDKI